MRFIFMRGITIIELLIVLGIIAIIMSVGAVSFFGFKQKNDLDLAANQIVAALRSAQECSRSQENGGGCFVFFLNSFEPKDYLVFYAISDIGNSVKRIDLPSTVKFTDPVEGGFKFVTFYKVTGLPNVSLTVIISLKSDSSKTKTITVNANGRIQQ